MDIDETENWFKTVTLSKGTKIRIKLDTGAQCNDISLSLIKKFIKSVKALKVKRLNTYSEGKIEIIGKM